ncbi:ATP-binding cassette sub-family B member 9-like isoform X1 [Branchiostoma floridae]|uniref:ATP-binding cassette sub-family B member 9-like isoform X1 n=3 Tax=Branchiostoma floridae TaxID=7739 RepID=A0A9J7LX80_BRAFL|nr:ATP-binding cassette sub-family B member 9-like isoform X1 [Branchiostoma floridae]
MTFNLLPNHLQVQGLPTLPYVTLQLKMAGKLRTTAAVVLLSLADVAANTILYMNGADLHKFTHDISFFSIFTSLLDICIFGMLRGCVTFGAVLSVLFNARDAVPRLKLSRSWVGVLPAAMCAYSLVKILLYSEKEVEFPHKPWFWVVFVGSIVGCVVFYLNWTLLSKISTQSYRSINSEEGTDEERERLLESEVGSKSNLPSVKKLFSYSKPAIPYFLAATTFLIGGAVGDIFVPYYTGQVIDGIAKIQTSQDKFIHAIIVMSLLKALSAVCYGMRSGLFEITKIKLNIRIRNLLFRSITRQEIGFFDTIKTGEITSRLISDTTTTTTTLIDHLKVFCASMIRMVGTVIFMFRLSWRLSILVAILLPVMAVIMKVYGDYLKKVAVDIQTSFARANEVADETCSNMRTVRSFANEDMECERYSNRLKDTYKLYIKKALLEGSLNTIEHLFGLALFVLTLYYGGHLVMTRKMTGGTLVSFFLYLNRLKTSLEKLVVEVYAQLMLAAGASKKLVEYIDLDPGTKHDNVLAPARLEGNIEFRDVSFAYPSRKNVQVLKDLSFKVSPGEVVALVGPSGSGKSTCFNLLEHFYETMSGQVLLDGNPIMAYDHKFLHRMVALVGQEPVLFARSIKDNISYALDNCSLEEVQRVARQANAHQFITELPEGYETETGEKGMQLSGGQKQRVAIARALIRKPAVLLLDEATSALDAESEQTVQQAIENLHGHTVIVIAHRLSTVEKADRIIVIDKGTVVEQGRHGELMQQDGLYAKMARRQLLGLDKPG